MLSNLLKISDSPATAENVAASSPESEAFTRAPTPRLLSEPLPLPESASTPAPTPSSSSSRPRIPDSASIPDSSSFATTGNAPIDHETKTGVPLESPASPISFSSCNTSRSQWPTSQTRVASPELLTVKSSPRNVTSDPHDEPRQPPELASSRSLVSAAPASAYSANSTRADAHQLD